MTSCKPPCSGLIATAGSATFAWHVVRCWPENAHRYVAPFPVEQHEQQQEEEQEDCLTAVMVRARPQTYQVVLRHWQSKGVGRARGRPFFPLCLVGYCCCWWCWLCAAAALTVAVATPSTAAAPLPGCHRRCSASGEVRGAALPGDPSGAHPVSPRLARLPVGRLRALHPRSEGRGSSTPFSLLRRLLILLLVVGLGQGVVLGVMFKQMELEPVKLSLQVSTVRPCLLPSRGSLPRSHP